VEEETSDFILYTPQGGKPGVALYVRDGNVWLNQAQLAQVFGSTKQNIGQHIAAILEEGELDENSVVKYYFTTASDGKNYKVAHYSLEMALAIGFRVRSKRGTQFRIWANQNLKEYIVKGFVMDDERLKNPDGRPDYFDELLERIRDIRASEKRFYQKVKDLLALSSDYDATDKETQVFFAETQNKLLYAVTGQTAAELIVSRADAEKSNMALTSWKGEIVRKQDIFIAKNYLSHDEIDSLNRLTVIFLETAELRVKERKDLTISYWKDNVNKLLEFNDKIVLKDAGTVSHTQMEAKVSEIYEEFDKKRKSIEAQARDLKELEELNEKIKKK
jgi:hypothetical protein